MRFFLFDAGFQSQFEGFPIQNYSFYLLNGDCFFKNIHGIYFAGNNCFSGNPRSAESKKIGR